MQVMILLRFISCLVLVMCICRGGSAQEGGGMLPPKPQADSVMVPRGQRDLFYTPKRNLLTTHIDIVAGPSQVIPGDENRLGWAATAKGLYMLTGALYVNMGLGISGLSSRSKPELLLPQVTHKAVFASIPLGIGFTMGDDRAQIINSVDFLPIYYIDNPEVKHLRQFSYGLGVDLGFHIRIRQRLHLGMLGKLQLIESFNRDEATGFPRFGLGGAGLVLRYD